MIQIKIILADDTVIEKEIPYEDFYDNRSYGSVQIDDFAIQLIPFTLYRQVDNVICGEVVTDFKEFSIRRVNR